ncbi:extracellular solute-binding protein [Microvirgula aerodenitrificans]|uniref:extracellular solute-binding protein n=1 Tax=Microvirgula aerodenitrificans TaxID=57480 RepID=UPI00248F3BFE|nr:extracellular solute-binding protein [Microvirgula aerodenitrificans]
MTVALACVVPAAMASSSVALGYTPKYPAGFRQFDYVNGDAPRGGRLRLPALGSFDTLNPFTLKGDKEAGVAALMFDTLAEKSLDEPFSLYGLLADDMRLAPDGKSVTFHLNPRARFSNGDPVLAADVVASFDALTRDKSAHPRYRFYWADITRAVAVGPLTVRFDFRERNAELHMIIAELPIFSRKWGNGKPLGERTLIAPIGSGPYRLKSYQLGRQSVFERRDDYWARDLPVRRGMFNFDQVVFRYLRDDTVRLESFKAGEYDVSPENIAKQWARGYRGERFDDGRIVKATFPHQNPQGMQGFAMNLRRAPFQDRRVREAMVLAFDFEWANHKLFYDQYSRSNSYFSNSELAAQGMPSAAELKLLEPYRGQLPPAVFGPAVTAPDNGSPAALRANLRRAAALLTEAGYPMRGSQRVDARGRPLELEFQDRRVREAMVLAFDFEWANHKLFYDQYSRSNSYFSNSELAAQGMPSAAELKLLEPYRGQLPPAVFGPAVTAPDNGSPAALRANLRRAAALLTEAGYPMRGSQRVDARGRPLELEFLTFSKTYERIIAPYARNLARLGILLSVRTVDPAIYQQRSDDFDFDMTVAVYPMSLSPGNEMFEFFGSKTAESRGSTNTVGLKSPVVDHLLGEFTRFQNREQLVTASRALDRVLRADYLMVPNWHLARHRIAYWNRFGYPKTLPRYYQPLDWVIRTWWEVRPATRDADADDGAGRAG